MTGIARKAPVLLTIGLAGSCIFPTDSCGCSPPSRRAVVFGTVTSANAPVADAGVTALPAQADSTFPHEVHTTDQRGRYRFVIFDDRFLGQRATLRVNPDSSSGLAAASVDFHPPWSFAEPPDSVRVDVSLTPE